jgi:hypothetical protein
MIELCGDRQAVSILRQAVATPRFRRTMCGAKAAIHCKRVAAAYLSGIGKCKKFVKP